MNYCPMYLKRCFVRDRIPYVEIQLNFNQDILINELLVVDREKVGRSLNQLRHRI